MNKQADKFFGIPFICSIVLALPACTFIKNYSKPTSDQPIPTAVPAEDFRCKGANTEYWNDAANTKVTHTFCRVNLGLIDAASVDHARKDNPSQAGLVFMGNISKTNKEVSDDSLLAACADNRGESLIMIRMNAGLKDEVVFCRFSDGSILEGRTLFFGSLAPGYTELSGLLE